jgi:hypothetical protein
MFQTVDEYGIAAGGEIEVQVFSCERDPQEKTQQKKAFILSLYEFHSAERIVSMNDYSSSTTRAASTHVCRIMK